MRISLKNLWVSTIDKYLDSVQYAFQKRDEVSKALEKMPEPLHSKKFKHISFVLLILAVLIFLMSCTAHAKTEKEQLFIQRQELQIQNTEVGSTTGSIWADLPSAQGLSVGREPRATGDSVRISIPDELREGSAEATPLASFSMTIVGVEPGGHMMLRGVQTFTNEEGSKKTVTVFAQVPSADVRGPTISATQLNKIAVEETLDDLTTTYQTTNWDKNITRKLSLPIPDTKKIIAGLEQQKKELEEERKNLASQRQALQEQSERLAKDRQRLETDRSAFHTMAAPQPVSPTQTASADTTQQEDSRKEQSNKL